MTHDPTDPDNWPPIVHEQPPFAQMIGATITSISEGQLEATLVARPELLNRNGFLHGGAILAVADNLGGTAAFVNLKPEQATTTVESKTNFLRSIKPGDRVKFVCVTLHKGRKTMAFQTNVYRSDSKLAAIVTQTQIIVSNDDPAVNGRPVPA